MGTFSCHFSIHKPQLFYLSITFKNFCAKTLSFFNSLFLIFLIYYTQFCVTIFGCTDCQEKWLLNNYKSALIMTLKSHPKSQKLVTKFIFVGLPRCCTITGVVDAPPPSFFALRPKYVFIPKAIVAKFKIIGLF